MKSDITVGIDDANLEYESESKKSYSPSSDMCNSPCHIATIFLFLHSESCQSVCSCELWGLKSENSVIKKQSWLDGVGI